MNCGCGAKSDGLSGFQLVPLGVVQHCGVAGLPDLQRLGRPRGRRAEHAVCMRKCCLIQCCLNAMQNHIPFVVRDVAASLVPFVYRYQHTPRSRSSCQLLFDRLMKASNREQSSVAPFCVRLPSWWEACRINADSCSVGSHVHMARVIQYALLPGCYESYPCSGRSSILHALHGIETAVRNCLTKHRRKRIVNNTAYVCLERGFQVVSSFG